MKSQFIGAGKLVLYKLYSRADVGFRGTQLAGMRISDNQADENERILFINLGDKYDNRLTKAGLIMEPRLDVHILSKPTAFVYYLFLRNGNRGDYYYVGTSNSQKPHNSSCNLIAFDAAGIPSSITNDLGSLQLLP
jgi:hypothetical protein